MTVWAKRHHKWFSSGLMRTTPNGEEKGKLKYRFGQQGGDVACLFKSRENPFNYVKKIKAKRQISVSFLACFKKTPYFCTAKTVE